jgi:pyridoxamine 5'-phosphate oxidase-like protein
LELPGIIGSIVEMELKEYFENTDGTGILATANAEGKVDMAIYARPHVFDRETIGFIMRGRLSHRNLQSNTYAAYMYIEKGQGYQGKRLYLQKTREEKDPEIIEEIRRKPKREYADSSDEDTYLVYFRIEDVRPLVGDKT